MRSDTPSARTAGPWRPWSRRSLRTQLVGLLVVLSVLGGVLAASLLAWQQGRLVRTSLESTADAMVNNFAIGAAQELAEDDFASLDVLLREYVSIPGVLRVHVFDERKITVGHVMRRDDSIVSLYEPTPLPDSFEEGRTIAERDGRRVLTAWKIARAGSTPIGYVHLDFSLASVDAAQRQAFRTSALATLGITAFLALSLILFLRRPLQAIQEASHFAGNLDRKQGKRMRVDRFSRELTQLGESLNDASLRLKANERALRESEAWASKLANVASRTSNVVVITDADVRIEWVNEAFTRVTGYTLDDVRGKNPGRVLQGPDTNPETVEEIREHIRRREGFQVQLVNYDRTGRRYWIEIEAQPVFDDEGELTQYIAIETDITERLRNAEEIARQRDFAVTIMETVAQGITVVGADWRFEYVNPAFAAVVGVPPRELVGRSPTDLSLPGDAETLERIRADRRDGRSSTYEMQIRRPDGTIRDVLVTGVPRYRNGAFDGTISVVTDITARKREEQELRQAVGAAEQANRAKSEFLSRMSHELRTPLNAILGFTQLLQLDDLTDDQTDSLERIAAAGAHLLGLINEVLELSAIEAGRLAVAKEPVLVCDVVEDSVELLDPLARDRNVAFELVSPDPHLCVMADAQRLRQVLLNLLANGIKYNVEGGTVSLQCSHPSESVVRLHVRDTGPGIPPHKLKRLFQPFDRLDIDEGSHAAVEGTGIGLALTKRLVEAMDGSIGVSSEPGVGTEFFVDLPVAHVASDATVVTEERAVGAAAPQSEQGSAMRIVYVEDNLANLELVQKALGRLQDIELMSAMEGRLGLDLIQSQRPDLVLLDLHLPGLGGEQILDALVADEATAEIPVLVLSADAMKSRIERIAARKNVYGYLTKPLDVAELLSVVERLSTTLEPRP